MSKFSFITVPRLSLFLLLFILGMGLWTVYNIQSNWIVLSESEIHDSTTGTSWTIDIAQTSAEKARGLMFVKSLPMDRGMLFRNESDEIMTMWMKNTFIVLDMVFLRSDGEIAHIHKGAEPHSLSTISSVHPVRYVLELKGGEVDRVGLQVGGRLLHPWFIPPR